MMVELSSYLTITLTTNTYSLPPPASFIKRGSVPLIVSKQAITDRPAAYIPPLPIKKIKEYWERNAFQTTPSLQVFNTHMQAIDEVVDDLDV
jgi:hypothetical protein